MLKENKHTGLIWEIIFLCSQGGRHLVAFFSRTVQGMEGTAHRAEPCPPEPRSLAQPHATVS